MRNLFIGILPFSWSLIAEITRSRVPQICAFIPIIGYALLWSEEFQEMIRLSEIGGSFIFDFRSRLYLLYFGSISFLIGWTIYRFRCDEIVRNSSSDREYVHFVLSTSDRHTLDSVFAGMRTAFDKGRGHGTALDRIAERHDLDELKRCVDDLDNKKGNITRYMDARLTNDVAKLQKDENWTDAFKSSASKMLYAFYDIVQTDRFYSRMAVSILYSLGGIALFLPAFEAFVMILLDAIGIDSTLDSTTNIG